MRAPWVDSAVVEFGRHFGFSRFALNERGVAAARFENGASVALECAHDALCLQVRVPMAADGASLRKLLVAAHPGNRFAYPLRTAYLAKTGQALFLVKFPERDVTETALWQVFSEMWAIAARFGGTTSWN